MKDSSPSAAARYLNLGCGGRTHPDWINIDIAPGLPEVMQHDLSKGIPFPDQSCEIVYHAAVLEHLRRADAETFVTDCFRVLKSGGILRVGVPDLEQICRVYLDTLDKAAAGDPQAAHDYDWMMLELLDQTVRETGGGGMLRYLHQTPLPNQPFVFERIGEEGRELVESLQRKRSKKRSKRQRTGVRAQLRLLPRRLKQQVLQLLLGEDGMQALAIGRFRLAGEVHQWMYDRYSLARLLRSVGFEEVVLQSAETSQIPNWQRFHLDTTPEGNPIKPDMFFMEAVRP